MHWRCLKDPCFGYCRGTPKFGDSNIIERPGRDDLIVRTCIADPKTCRKYQVATQVIKPSEEDLAKISTKAKIIKANGKAKKA